ncbi:RasGTPase-activating protein [Cavenderia fasciculata]|uniref:RasGTPase-activating protein n=1 Tax=Cavenderia fasciculata TaxID=261658 RepID=F4Q6Q8_CACFS|nr:RasGTPase-activating protein [Cavenderia fasciculata]EGG16568.1 RasGTPase-activating protein [Cavenderia fasciculata]|eukprot:XP_004354968.1 RasGTPase-activating protein [Cavenderia fasciculata]
MNIKMNSAEKLYNLQELLQIQNISKVGESKTIEYLKKNETEICSIAYDQLLQNGNLQKAIAEQAKENNRSPLNVPAGVQYARVSRVSHQTGYHVSVEPPPSSPPEKRVYYPCKDERAGIETLIRMLRVSPEYLSRILLAGEEPLSSLPNEESLPNVVLSMFGNCTTPNDELLFMQLIQTMINIEYAEHLNRWGDNASPSSYSNKENLSNKLLNAHVERSYKAPYHSLFMDFIEGLVSGRAFLFENKQDHSSIIDQISLSHSARSIPTPTSSSSSSSSLSTSISSLSLSSTFIASPSIMSPRESLNNEWVDTGAREFISRVLDQVDKIPYTLRWLSKHTVQLGRSSHTDGDKEAIFNTIFYNLLVPILVRPDQFLGIEIPMKSMNQYFAIANRIRDFMTKPETIPQSLKELLIPKIKNFYQQVTLVPDLEEYFKAPSSRNQECQYKIPMFMSDLCKLFSVIESSNKVIRNTAIDQSSSEIINLFDKSNFHSKIDYSYDLMEIHLGGQDKPVEKPTITPEQYLLKYCKNQLTQCLLMLPQLCGCTNSNETICNILKTQQNRNRDSKFPEIIKETIKSLNQLPIEYQQLDFGLLMSEMELDVQAEKLKHNKEKTAITKNINALNAQLESALSQESILIESLVYQKRKAYDKITNVLKSYADQNIKRVLCHCDPIKRFQFPQKAGEVDCEVCETLPKILRNTMERLIIALNSSWETKNRQALQKVIISMEKSILSEIYNHIFTTSQRDVFFFSDLNRLQNILGHEAFKIKESVYGTVLPFESAQRELQRINLFITPKDKIQIIKNTWSLVTNTMKALDQEIAPDEYYSIMSFVIFKANVPHLLTNIQYIKLYSNNKIVDENDEHEFTIFLGAVSYVDEVVEKANKTIPTYFTAA